MKNSITLINKKILPIFLAFVLLFNLTTDAVAQYKSFSNTKNQYLKPYAAVQDNTRVVRPDPRVFEMRQKALAAEVKLQESYAKKQEEEKKTADALKAAYKLTAFDKSGYLQAGQWVGKRKDGSVKNTGFFGEIVIQVGPNRGKVITESSITVKENGKEIEVPLLNPYLSPSDREILRNGNINNSMIKSAQYWLRYRQSQRISPFAQGTEVVEKAKWAYSDFDNMLKRSLFDIQKDEKIAERIKNGEKNPYFVGAEYDNWAKIEARVHKEEDKNNRANAVMAGNNLLSKKDALKQVDIVDAELEKNKRWIERDVNANLSVKINKAQKEEQARVAQYNQQILEEMKKAPKHLQAQYKGMLIKADPRRYDKYISIGDAVACGFITKEEAESVYHKITDKYISKNVNAKFEKYLTEESDHNTANLGIWGSISTRFNYFWTHVQNNSIIGKASLGLYALGEGLVTWKDPSKIYQRDFQRNQNYLNYYNMGTKWSFVDDIALTAGTFGSDAGVFKVIGMASAAVLPRITTASSTFAKIVLPSVQTGTVLGIYDGVNSLGNELGYKNFSALTAQDWKKIGYNTGRGFTSGAIVGQYGRVLQANGLAGNTVNKLTPQPVSTQVANGVRNVGLGMSEGMVFSVAGAGYDKVTSLWLPAPGTPGYIGGNPNAFKEMTPESLAKDMIKFYFGIKLPGNAMSMSEGIDNGYGRTTKKSAPVEPLKYEPVKETKKVSEGKKSPQTEQLQFTLIDKEGNTSVLNRNGVLTAVVGGGSGGSGRVSTAKPSAAEQAKIDARTQRDRAESEARATAAAEEYARETAEALANPKPFKGNWIFNKPYKELSPWRKWAFDTYYLKLNPAFKLTGEIGLGLAKNPGKTLMMGSLPMGGAAESLLASRIGVYSTIGAQTNSFSLVKQAESFGKVERQSNNPFQQNAKINLPELVAVLNEPHTGSTGKVWGQSQSWKNLKAKISLYSKLTKNIFIPTLINPKNQGQSNRYAEYILGKGYKTPSEVSAIVKSAANDEYKSQALFYLYSEGLLWKDVKGLNKNQLKLITKDGILKLYNDGFFKKSFASLKDTYMPKQITITEEDEARIEGTKQFVNNENELVQSSLSEWGTGETPFEAPVTNKKLIENALRPSEYVQGNSPKGKATKTGTYYRNAVPVYYRNSKGVISNKPRILLKYNNESTISTILSILGLATKRGYKIPKGLVLAMDEEGNMKYVMPMGKLSEVETNKKSSAIIIDQTESNRVAVDSEFTSSDLVEVAYILGKDCHAAFEIILNKPDSFKIFLTLHALFIGNDAGNTLTGEFKSSVGKAGGAAAINAIGGVGYLTPFVGGSLMGYMSRKGHVPTILTVYAIILATLAYSMVGVGMIGNYSFPANPTMFDYINLGIPTTIMVLGASILNTSIQTLLNIYKDPVARSTAHLQFANNKNYARLGVSTIVALALVTNFGLNWSVVVPAATGLLLLAGALLPNTRIYEKYKTAKKENKAKREAEKRERDNLSQEDLDARKEAERQAKAARKALEKEFHEIYKKELSKKHEMRDISRRVSKLYASYAASLLVITQTLKTVADQVSSSTGQSLALGLLALVATPILLKIAYDKIKGKNSNILKNLKKYAIPLIFFATTLATMSLSTTGKALGMTLTTLCLLTTTMMRVVSTELIKERKATDDQLSGVSIPIIALMTSLLIFAPTTGTGAIASLLAVLMLYAGTAVPGGLDSARMQNFITSEYKVKKADLLKQKEEGKISKEEYDKAKKRLAEEEKYMSSKGASKFSYLNGAGIIGILMTVFGGWTFMDLVTHTPSWMPQAFAQWQGAFLESVSSITGNAGESHSLAFTRVILAYAAVVAIIMAFENMHLTKTAKGLFKPQQITQEDIDNNLVTPKTFDISKKNAGIKLSVLDKELKEINGIVFKYGVSSEQKMTETLKKLFYINNRLKAIGEILGDEAIAKSLEQIKYITANLEGMIQHNDLSFQYKRQFSKLKDALINGHMKYLEEGIYTLPKSLKSYILGVMMVRELDNRAAYILANKVHKDSYKEFLKYYSRAVQELTRYAQDTPNDAERVNLQINKIQEISCKLERVDHSKHQIVPKEDIENLMEAIKLFKGKGTCR